MEKKRQNTRRRCCFCYCHSMVPTYTVLGVCIKSHIATLMMVSHGSSRLVICLMGHCHKATVLCVRARLKWHSISCQLFFPLNSVRAMENDRRLHTHTHRHTHMRVSARMLRMLHMRCRLVDRLNVCLCVFFPSARKTKSHCVPFLHCQSPI